MYSIIDSLYATSYFDTSTNCQTRETSKIELNFTPKHLAYDQLTTSKSLTFQSSVDKHFHTKNPHRIHVTIVYLRYILPAIHVYRSSHGSVMAFFGRSEIPWKNFLMPSRQKLVGEGNRIFTVDGRNAANHLGWW